eukprot:5631156-Prymnesium_polylepis.1
MAGRLGIIVVVVVALRPGGGSGVGRQSRARLVSEVPRAGGFRPRIGAAEVVECAWWWRRGRRRGRRRRGWRLR